MAGYPHIERYRAELDELIAFGGSDNELNIRTAFQNCLSAYCHDHRERLGLVPELATARGVIPDGTVNDSLRLPRGYWEAKDTHDDLDAEIQRKFNLGYPKGNIIFEDSREAVLIQNGDVAMRVDMRREGELHRLIRLFLDYELPEIEDFRKAQSQFKDDLPSVLASLRETIEDARQHNAEYQDAAAVFLELCRQSIGPDVSDEDVREMLLQHILTKDIFLNIFRETQFHSENNIARQLDNLERTFFFGGIKKEAMDRLLRYYNVISVAALQIADYGEKQGFLKAIYEDFYKAYNPAAADRLGVVYTPNEVVDFITNLIEYLPAEKLEHKYRHEMHANEVAILPYYIANLNIEYTYREKTGQYVEFPNLVFVDTLDNMDWEGSTGGAVTRQGAFELGGLSFDNWYRMQGQNEKTISVIMGNPPYNANQQNENDNNRNREYPAMDQRIKETYIAESTAQKTKQYDMYKRFIRWASDRLDDDGIIAFISNRAFLDSRQDDGFRKVVADEFNELWAVDLKGNARTSGERRRQEGGNIFDDKIRVGVAIYFLVRRRGANGFRMFYNAVEDYAKSPAKAEYIRNKTISDFEFKEVTPDSKHNWLNQSNSDFEQLIPLANRETKFAKTADDERAMFKLYSLGIATNRDEWVYDFDHIALEDKVKFFCETYTSEMRRLETERPDANSIGDWVDRSIKWTSELERHLVKGERVTFASPNITRSLHRPFVFKHCYYAPIVTHRRYQQTHIFPHEGTGQNKVICFCANRKHFYVLATSALPDLHFTGDTQCLPLYRYTEDGERVSNITEWGLRQINEHYRKEFGERFQEAVGGERITAEDVFAYSYAVLHDPMYRHDYAVDLLREFPRLPLYDDWGAWVKMGRELLDLHIGFEDVEPYPLEQVDKSRSGDGVVAPRVMLRANAGDKERGEIHIDSETVLRGVPEFAWEYKLGNRTAIEWVLDQYKEKKPRDPTIRERFNTYRFADYKEQVIDLLRQVCTVSVRTTEIVEGMADCQAAENGVHP